MYRCTAQRTEKNETRRKLWKECREDDELLDCLESDQDSGLVTRPRG